MSQTHGWFSKLSVVEDEDFLSDSEVKEVLVHFDHLSILTTLKNKILLKKNIHQMLNLILNIEYDFKQ